MVVLFHVDDIEIYCQAYTYCVFGLLQNEPITRMAALREMRPAALGRKQASLRLSAEACLGRGAATNV